MDGYGLVSTERLEQITHNQNRIECLGKRVDRADNDIAKCYTKSEVDAKLECITDKSELEDHLRDLHAHQELFDQKVDKREGYSLMSDDEIAQVTTNKDDITALDNRITTNEINISKTYTQSEVDALLTNKANKDDLDYKAPLNNILINPIVPNQIINQRATSSYSAVNQYTIDRWKLISGTLTVNVGSGSVGIPESVTLNGVMRQIIEFPRSYSGKTVTASVIGGTVSINGSEFSESVTVPLPSVLTSLYVDIKGTNSKPSQAQLIFGETVQPFNPRSFGEELALCQRYYEPRNLIVFFNSTGAKLGGNNYDGVSVFFKIPKRVAPTTITYSLDGTANKITSSYFAKTIDSEIVRSQTFGAVIGISKGYTSVAGEAFEFTYSADAEL